MDAHSALERTITKVLSQAEGDMITQIDSAYDHAISNLHSSRGAVETDYNRIIDNAKKQAENLKRQIIGSSRLSARNKQLVLIENAVSNAFIKASEKIESVRNSDKYASMMKKLLEDGLNAVGGDVVIECNNKDKSTVKKLASEIERSTNVKIKVSDEAIDYLGGLRVKSKDGSMVYDNTLDSRIERLKPLIKKDIANMFMK
jgi:V/A-type H+-transporting ATPase subunit E